MIKVAAISRTLAIFFGLCAALTRAAVSGSLSMAQVVYTPDDPISFSVLLPPSVQPSALCQIVDRNDGAIVRSQPIVQFAQSIPPEGADNKRECRMPPLPSGSYEMRISGMTGIKPVFFGVVPLPTASFTPDRFFIINDHRYSVEDFSSYARFGFAMKRDLVSREAIQRSRDRFDWSTLDARLDMLRQARTRASIIVAYSPAWDRSSGRKSSHHAPPVDQEALDRYLQELGLRTPLDLVPTFEVWNEPNTADFFQGSVETYAALLKRTFVVSKQTTPDRIIHMGGMAGFDWDFLNRLEESGALVYSDAIAIHPYSWSESDAWLWGQLGRVIRWRDRVVPGLPIYCNEWGVEAPGNTPAELRRQANRLVRYTTIMRAGNVSLSGYYLWTQGPFRIVEGNGAPRPAALAQYFASQYLSHARYRGRFRMGNAADFAFCFERGDKAFLVAWSQNANVFLPSDYFTAHSRVVDALGHVIVTDPTKPFPLSEAPVYIENVSPTVVAALEGPAEHSPGILSSERNPPPGWLDFRYPDGTQSVPVSNRYRTLTAEIHNASAKELSCTMLLHGSESVEIRPVSETTLAIPSRGQRSFRFKIRASSNAVGAGGTFSLQAKLDGEHLPPVRVRTRGVDGDCWEFVVNTYEDTQNRFRGKNVKTAPRRLWTDGATGEAVWHFDLRHYKSARVDAETTPYIPQPSSVQFSKDGKKWVLLPTKAGTKVSWDCSAFAGGALYIRYSSGSIPGAALHKLIVYANLGKTS